MPSPARRSDPSFLSSRTMSALSSSSTALPCFFEISNFSARCAATCDCVISLLLGAIGSRRSQEPERAACEKQVRRPSKRQYFLGMNAIFEQPGRVWTARERVYAQGGGAPLCISTLLRPDKGHARARRLVRVAGRDLRESI